MAFQENLAPTVLTVSEERVRVPVKERKMRRERRMKEREAMAGERERDNFKRGEIDSRGSNGHLAGSHAGRISDRASLSLRSTNHNFKRKKEENESFRSGTKVTSSFLLSSLHVRCHGELSPNCSHDLAQIGLLPPFIELVNHIERPSLKLMVVGVTIDGGLVEGGYVTVKVGKGFENGGGGWGWRNESGTGEDMCV